MEKRKLATIVVISDIRPIEGADNIEQCKIKGWNVVIKKNEFKDGDLAVYCEIDSLMPQRSEFEFLAPRKYRIKTTRLKGTLSQGIAFPLSILPMSVSWLETPDGLAIDVGGGFLEPVGVDVTDLLGITKYEEPIPACLGGVALGRFFSHSIKTDEERIQNLTEMFREYHDKYTWTATEKLDGSSCTFTIFEDEFGVASRNLRLKEHPENEKNSFWKFARANDVEEKMREFMGAVDLKALTLQGELIGEGIQKNKYHIKGQEVRFFRLFDPIKYKFLWVDHSESIIEELGLKFVPIIERDMTLPDTLEELILMADGRSELYETAREGIVFVAESLIDLDARSLEDYQGRLSFKVISNKFILKHKL